MGSLIDFISKLFDISDWPPRWNCGTWSEFHGWLYITSDVAIWLAYFIIPVILIWFIQRKPNIPFLPVFWLFGAFIILCGTTHILDALLFWWPAYRLSALVKFLTALVSMATAFALIRDLPKALNINSGDNKKVRDLESRLLDKDKEIDLLNKKLAELQR